MMNIESEREFDDALRNHRKVRVLWEMCAIF